MIKIVTCDQTCDACPSQWECTTDDGRMVYIRYRSGRLSVRVSPNPTADIFDAVNGKYILDENDNSMLGVLEFDEMKERTEHILDWANI